MATDKKDIELRSEKVRNIVGKVPPLLLRKGITIIFLVIILFLIGTYFMPYPETAKTKVKICTIPPVELIRAPHNGIICISKRQEIRISKGQKLGYILVKDSLMELISPIRGRLIINAVNETFVEQNEILFAVVPDTMVTYCRGNIPGEMIHKIKVGQEVDVKYTVAGAANNKFLHGKVSQLYPLPIDTLHNQYKIDILLDALPYSYAVESLFQEADATIHLSDKSVLGRFLESLFV
jgi:hypothetical protein